MTDSITSTSPAATGTGETYLPNDVTRALEIAYQFVDAGIPVGVAKRCPPDCPYSGHEGGTGTAKSGYDIDSGWNLLQPSRAILSKWRPGDGLFAVMGHGIDLLDADPRNGSTETVAGLTSAGMWPNSYGHVTTPSGGTHDYIKSLGVGSKDGFAAGLDLKGGYADGGGRGFAWLPPTVKLSKVTGELGRYCWEREPDFDLLTVEWSDDDSGADIAFLVTQARGRSSSLTRAAISSTFLQPTSGSGEAATDKQVSDRIWELRDELANHPKGGGANEKAAQVAFWVGQYVGAGQMDQEQATQIMLSALAGWTYDARNDERGMVNTICRQISEGVRRPRMWEAPIAKKPATYDQPPKASHPFLQPLQVDDDGNPLNPADLEDDDEDSKDVPAETVMTQAEQFAAEAAIRAAQRFEGAVQEAVERKLAWAEAERRIGGKEEGGVSEDAVAALMAKLLTADQLDDLPNPQPLIVDVLDLDSECWIIGAPGGFKSFVALDFTGHVGAGKFWQGKKTVQGVCIYVVAEGAKGIKLRKRAWCETYGPMKDVHFLPEPVQVKDAQAWDTLVEVCKRMQPKLIVLDTQARITVGLNENTSELSTLVEAVRKLRAATGACILIVHHIGRNGHDARGWSGVDGAQDSEIKVTRPEGNARKEMTAKISFDKQKDASEDSEFHIQMQEHDWGIDPDTGRKLSSLSIKPLDPFWKPKSIEPEWLANLMGHQANIVGVIQDNFGKIGGTRAEIKGVLEERFGEINKSSFSTAWNKLIERAILVKVEGQRWTVKSLAPDGGGTY